MIENGNKTFKQKINEPILNVKQILAMCLTILYEVISNLIYAVTTEQPNWYFIIANISVGILVIVLIGLMRASFPEIVPDKTFVGIFKMFFKQMVDVVFDRNMGLDSDDKMTMLERNMVWSVREWDVLYQDKLKEQIAYYWKKRKEDERDPNSTSAT